MTSKRAGTPLRVLLGAAGVAFCALACSQVLGLEDRKLDPTLGAAGEGGSGTAGTSTTGGSGGVGGSGGTAGGGGGGGDLCEEYCDTIELNCAPPDHAQYTSKEQCLATCAIFNEGDTSEMNPSGNTVACRLNQAKLAIATGEPLEHCSAAGPGGADKSGQFRCGEHCDGYCAIMNEACVPPRTPFANVAECISACRDLPNLGGFNQGIDSGNSVQCRIWHVTAATLSPDVHCGHASGDAPCVDATGGAGGAGGTGGSGGVGGTGTGMGGASGT